MWVVDTLSRPFLLGDLNAQIDAPQDLRPA